MARERVHGSAAERQKAYRARLAARNQLSSIPPEPRKVPRKLSRPALLQTALDTVLALQMEYEHWRSRLPDFQEGTEQQAKLDDTIDSLEQAAEILANIDPPKGYGRD